MPRAGVRLPLPDRKRAMREAATLLAALAVVLSPGAALVAAVGVRRPVWFAGLAPAASVGVATLVGMACALLGVRYGIVPLAVATALLLVVAVVVHRRRPRPRPRLRGAAVLAGPLVALAGIALGLRTWLSGLAGDLSTPPQEHDTIVHSELVAYIARTGRGAVWQLLPVDLLDGAPVSFYPSGMHLLSATTGDLTGGPVRGLNGVTVVLLVLGLALSVAALAATAARRARLGVPATLMAAGVAVLVAVGMQAPTITLAAQGGILPNAASLALAPGFVAALLTLRRGDRLAALPVAVAAVGLVALHPSAVMTVGVTLVAWWIGDLATRGGLARLRGQVVPLALVGGLTVLLGAPLLAQLVGQTATRTAAFAPDVSATTLPSALRHTLALPLTGYLPQYQDRVQFAVVVLAAVAAVVLLATRRALGLLTALAAWAAVSVAMLVSPGSGPEALVTGFFYNSFVRVRTHVHLLVPTLVGVGLLVLASLVAARLRRLGPVRRGPLPAPAVAAVLVLLGATAYAVGPSRGYADVNAHYLASRYGHPDIDRVGADDRAAFDFLNGRVGPGERVMNSANDGSTYLYVDKGIPVVNTVAMGFERAPYTYRLLQRFNQYPNDREIRRLVLELHITWVYVDAAPPAIWASGSPGNWAGTGVFTTAPGLTALAGLPGLTEEFRSGQVRVYRLDRATVEHLDG
ncbi:hypothetical protein GCM10010492_43980 [Saccharothrix mutabilis subsp. mutabilis]|uniref:Uncharacterized protein n=2 Tax=Saccharothrix mutabilis TaxID=33921 RepID=A0ABP3DV21_9PSEU